MLFSYSPNFGPNSQDNQKKRTEKKDNGTISVVLRRRKVANNEIGVEKGYAANTTCDGKQNRLQGGQAKSLNSKAKNRLPQFDL